MGKIRLTRSAGRSASLSHDIIIGAAVSVLIVTVFWIDTFTTIESAIAVLYVIALLLSAEILSRQGVLLVAAISCLLATVSYAATHPLDADLPAFLRLVVSLAALCITCALILRNDQSRAELIASNAALKDSETRYRSIFEESRVALWERDYAGVRKLLMKLKDDGVTDILDYARKDPDIVARCIAVIGTVAANDAAKELLGNIGEPKPDGSMRRYLAPDDATFLDLMDAIFRGADHFEGKGKLITASGQEKLVLMSMRFPDDPAKFDRVIVGMVDITEREMTQKALLEAQAELTRAARAAMVGALSASLAHELNQPLGALVVNAQTMLRWIDRDPPDLAAIRRSAERMIRDSQRASDIIHNTRSMLSDDLRPPERVDLPDLIAETQALLEHDLKKDGVALNITYRHEMKAACAVRIELQQVLVNLISNGIQAMSDKSCDTRRLLIETDKRDDGFLRLSVRDFGPGISESVMARLFTPFFTTKTEGMGMGLSICRSIMEARGGELVARNHADGGAVFEMIIPVAGGAHA